MRRIYKLDLYLEIEIAEAPPDNAIFAKRLAIEVMRLLPRQLLEGVKLNAAEAIYRGHHVAAVRPRGATRQRISYRQP